MSNTLRGGGGTNGGGKMIKKEKNTRDKIEKMRNLLR
jgi:hypothetical protein